MAVRRSTWVPLRAGTLSDDLLVGLEALANGWRVTHTDGARAAERTSLSVEDEFERRTRIAAGTWQAIVWYRTLLRPNRRWVAVAFGSHRVLRTAVVPVVLPLVAVSSAVLARRSGLGRLLLGGQVIAYGAAALGAVTDSKTLAVPYQFAMLNTAAIRGGIRYFGGRQATVWKRTSRGQWS